MLRSDKSLWWLVSLPFSRVDQWRGHVKLRSSFVNCLQAAQILHMQRDNVTQGRVQFFGGKRLN